MVLSAPEDGAAVRGAEVTLSADATDNVAVDRVEFMVDGEKVGTDSTAENGNSYSVKWDATSVSDGPRIIEARAYDTSGQEAFSTRTLIVDNTAPTGTVLVNGGARNTKSSDVSLTLSASDPEPGSSIRWVRFTTYFLSADFRRLGVSEKTTLVSSSVNRGRPPEVQLLRNLACPSIDALVLTQDYTSTFDTGLRKGYYLQSAYSAVCT